MVRVRSVSRSSDGSWSFEITAEQKSCHLARAPPTSERVDFIVVEAGLSVEGWQAGKVRVHDTGWYRTSFLEEMGAGAHPIVISQVQTYDDRAQFVSTRHYFPPSPNFVAVDLEMEWPAARDYCRTHYHDLASIHSPDENVEA